MSLACGIAAAAWTVFALSAPFAAYSLFLASNAGSNILLILLALAVVIPLNALVSRITACDIPFVPMLITNVVLLVGLVYTYSIFLYTAVYIPIAAFLLVVGANALLFTFAKPYTVPKVKTVHHGRAYLALWGAGTGAAAAAVYILLFTVILRGILASTMD